MKITKFTVLILLSIILSCTHEEINGNDEIDAQSTDVIVTDEQHNKGLNSEKINANIGNDPSASSEKNDSNTNASSNGSCTPVRVIFHDHVTQNEIDNSISTIEPVWYMVCADGSYIMCIEPTPDSGTGRGSGSGGNSNNSNMNKGGATTSNDNSTNDPDDSDDGTTNGGSGDDGSIDVDPLGDLLDLEKLDNDPNIESYIVNQLCPEGNGRI